MLAMVLEMLSLRREHLVLPVIILKDERSRVKNVSSSTQAGERHV